ncbi:unnamed protein product [Adineta steineri]|uniref:Uncharacterized protein n=1 Tax=Adineta steineri TaxID=433720 RepID=A0A815GWX3_9BILA|nr:unnamed protein product [Adineta steineri]CAF3843174.1 unnamed protein product [Adineta steineri]
MMTETTEESTLDKLLKSRYPLTYYLSRQQQFINSFSSKQTVAEPTPRRPSSDAGTIAGHKRKTLLPPPPCFNVPDTLDFDATEYGHNDEINESAAMEEDNDTLLLKNIDTRTNDSISDIINEKHSLFIQRSSAIELEFSPYENNSPLRQAIENGLNIINK